jgi:hypothetical protein
VDAYKSRSKSDPEKIKAKLDLEAAKTKVAKLEGEIANFNNTHKDYDTW